jgi:hypothetical protein
MATTNVDRKGLTIRQTANGLALETQLVDSAGDPVTTAATVYIAERQVDTTTGAVTHKTFDWNDATFTAGGPLALRTGDYRLRFRVDQQTVIVEKIGHRAKFYEG